MERKRESYNITGDSGKSGNDELQNSDGRLLARSRISSRNLSQTIRNRFIKLCSILFSCRIAGCTLSLSPTALFVDKNASLKLYQ